MSITSLIESITLNPIAAAPVQRCECKSAARCEHEYGPCVLDCASGWELGYWNGEGWYALEGDPLQPRRFGLLPISLWSAGTAPVTQNQRF